MGKATGFRQRADDPDLPDPFIAPVSTPAAAPTIGADHAATIRADTDPTFARELAREARKKLQAAESDLPIKARLLRVLGRTIERLEDIIYDDNSKDADVVDAVRELSRLADADATGTPSRQPVNISFVIQRGVPQAEGPTRPPPHPSSEIGDMTGVTVESAEAAGRREDDIVIEPVSREIARMEAAARAVAEARVVVVGEGGTAGYMAGKGRGLAAVRRGRFGR